MIGFYITVAGVSAMSVLQCAEDNDFAQSDIQEAIWRYADRYVENGASRPQATYKAQALVQNAHEQAVEMLSKERPKQALQRSDEYLRDNLVLEGDDISLPGTDF